MDRIITWAVSLLEVIFTPVVLISMIPLLVAGCMTSLVVHIVRLDNQRKMYPPFSPLALAMRIFILGFAVGFIVQGLMQPIIFWMSGGNLPHVGPTAWITCGAFTPFVAWGIHRFIIWYDTKYGDGSTAFRLKVKHIPGIHNTGYEYGKEPPSVTELYSKWKDKIGDE